MIQANELRIGNIVSDEGNQRENCHAVVTELTRWLVHLKQSPEGNALARKYEQVTPIPLSPELLEACGFVAFMTNKEATLQINSDESGSFGLTCFDRTAKELYIAIETTGRNDDWESQYTSTNMPIQHLHQLQNLYFALTGTELSINFEKVKA